jgi:hypothetical protein
MPIVELSMPTVHIHYVHPRRQYTFVGIFTDMPASPTLSFSLRAEILADEYESPTYVVGIKLVPLEDGLRADETIMASKAQWVSFLPLPTILTGRGTIPFNNTRLLEHP